MGPDEADPTYTWSSEDVTRDVFVDPTVAATTYLAPNVDAPGRMDNLYLVSSDVVGTDWVFGRVNVFDRSEPLYRCE